MPFRRRTVVDDDRHFGLQALGTVDGAGLDRQLPVQLGLDALQGLVAPTEHQHGGTVGTRTVGDVRALGLNLLE
ncbi:hypothetical protein D3C72_1915360 [compost metagenome]